MVHCAGAPLDAFDIYCWQSIIMMHAIHGYQPLHKSIQYLPGQTSVPWGGASVQVNWQWVA